MRIGFLTLALVLGAALGGASARAAESAASVSTSGAASADQVQPRKRFGFVFGLTGITSLHAPDSPDKSSVIRVQTAPSWQLSSDYKLAFNLINDQDLRGQQDFTIYKSSLGLSRAALALSPYFSLSPALSVGVPLSKARRERESYLTGVAVIPRLTLDPSGGGGAGAFLFYWEPSLARLFHRYETSTSGASNNQYSLSNEVGAGVQLTSKLSVSASFATTTSWTYQLNAQQKFSVDGSIDYQLLAPLAVSLAYSNGGDALKANGFDSNLSVFNPEEASLSAGFTWTY